MTPSFISIFGIAKEHETLLGFVKSKLLNNPIKVMAELSLVLEKPGSIVKLIEKVKMRYSELYFLKNEFYFIPYRSPLFSLESRSVVIKGHETQGHGNKIFENI